MYKEEKVIGKGYTREVGFQDGAYIFIIRRSLKIIRCTFQYRKDDTQSFSLN